jgi:hypothetical protein
MIQLLEKVDQQDQSPSFGNKLPCVNKLILKVHNVLPMIDRINT